MSEDKYSLLNTHYHETFQVLEGARRHRERYLLFIFIIIGIMAFQIFSPQDSSIVISEATKHYLKIENSINVTYISTLLWFGLLAVVTLYFQNTIRVYKYSAYLITLETEMAKYFKSDIYSREGKQYLQSTPLFSEWLQIVYKVFLPGMLIFAVSLKVYSEWRSRHISLGPLLLNTFCFVLIVVSIVLYIATLKKLGKYERSKQRKR